LNAGYSSEQLLKEMEHTILWNDIGSEMLPTLRPVFEACTCAEARPARYQLGALRHRHSHEQR